MSRPTSKSYSYEDCYRALGLSADCQWSDIRLAYKKLIQKWHPDRYIENSPEKVAADDKIKSINIAYHRLSAYYRKNKSLPSAGFNEKSTYQPNSDDLKAEPKEPSRPDNIKKPAPTRDIKKQHKNNTFKGTIFVTFLTGLYFISTEDFTPPSLDSFSEQEIYSDESANKSLKNIAPDDNEYAVQNNTNDSLQGSSTEIITQEHEQEQEHIKIFFSNGSSMGDVVLIQGVPSATKDNIWYYGKSEIHFHEGKVIHWVRSTENPLRAQLSIK